MLSILSRRTVDLCDRQSRRQFLKIGGLALGGLSLPSILRAEPGSQAEPARSSRTKPSS